MHPVGYRVVVVAVVAVAALAVVVAVALEPGKQGQIKTDIKIFVPSFCLNVPRESSSRLLPSSKTNGSF